MSLISKNKTWADAENVNYTDLNANFDTVYTEVNGNLDNSNVDASAAIDESKIAFNTSSGHSHDGSDSKAIPKAFVWTVTGSATTGTSVTPVLVATGSLTLTKWYLNVKTAPTGASLIIDINKNGTSLWNTNPGNRPTIAAGDTSASGTSFDTTSLVEGDILTIDTDQVGSTVSGSDLTITLRT
jgi:hypothetical protein